jgi:hypothetical protein
VFLGIGVSVHRGKEHDMESRREHGGCLAAFLGNTTGFYLKEATYIRDHQSKRLLMLGGPPKF